MPRELTAAGPLCLRGVEITTPTAGYTVGSFEPRVLQRRAEGQGRLLRPLPRFGRPNRLRKRLLTISWADLGSSRARVEEVLAIDGTLRVVVWMTERLAWTLDASEDVYRLPMGWILAEDHLPEVAARSDVNNKLSFRLDDDSSSTELTVTKKTTAEMDAGGAVASGEIWVETTGDRIRIPSPVTTGAILHASVVPAYLMAEPSEDEVEITHWTRMPKGLRLEEL